jgi:hypothetical protein
MTTTVVALYDDLATAQQVAHELINAGFSRENLSLAAGDARGDYRRYIADEELPPGDAPGVPEASGAGVGAVVGGLGGLLVGLGTLLIPGVGPIIAAGPLLTSLASLGVGAGVGAIAGGLAGALADMGVPEEEANYYTEGIRRGGTLLTIQVANESIDQARDIMEHHNPIDIDERVNQWQQEGWSLGDASIPTNDRADTYNIISYENDDFDDYDVYDARFRQHYQDNYAQSNYAYDNYASAYRYGLDLANYHYYGGRRSWTEVEPEAHRAWEDQNPGTWEQFKDAVQYAWDQVIHSLGFDEDYEAYRSEFQRHYQENFAKSGYPYEQYDRAYHYGYGLSHDSRFSQRTWAVMEPEAQQYWEEQYGSTWEQFKDAVRYGWEKVKHAVGVH